MSCQIIAEAGVNHNGDIGVAFQLIEAAASCGADAVKFQTFRAEALVSKSAKKAEYQMRNFSQEDDSQLAMLEKLELGRADHLRLQKHCELHGIEFLSTGFDIASLEFLHDIGLRTAKIPSGEITNLPYLRVAASLFENIILSTGMSTLSEVHDALEVLLKGGRRKANITVLHCTTEYPATLGEVNLRAMQHLGQALGVSIGYSDHTLGIEVSLAAAALGASVIEKHLTIDRNMVGPDHKSSLEPEEMGLMVRGVRNIQQALGVPDKVPSAAERRNSAVVRKSLVAAESICAGELFSSRNLTTKRPGTGISPMLWDQVMGRAAPRDFAPDDLIEL